MDPDPVVRLAALRGAGAVMTELIPVASILTCIAWPRAKLLTWLSRFMPAH